MPTVVLLANSHSSLGAGEIPEKSAGHPAHHVRTPKALLPATSSTHKCILDEWWALVKPATSDGPARAYLVSNAAYFKHFERWATASGFPTENIINDGTRAMEAPALPQLRRGTRRYPGDHAGLL